MRDLAARLGATNQQVSHLELGKRQLTTDWLIRLSAVLDCHPWEIVAQASDSLTERERRMLARFRSLSDEQQEALLAEPSSSDGPVSVG